MIREATLSEDRKYRYSLSRCWVPQRGRACWIMLNPSTADADFDDPTIRRCIRFTEGFGKGELVVVNLCAFRATKPRELLDIDPEEAVGPDNGEHVYKSAAQADIVVAAWGSVHQTLRRWAGFVTSLVMREQIPLWCLGYNGDGSPKHPLYVAADQLLMKWPKS